MVEGRMGDGLCEVVDLAMHRRRLYESTQTEEQLSLIDFDEFGHPKPLDPVLSERLKRKKLRTQRWLLRGVAAKEEQVDAMLAVKRMLEPTASTLIEFDPNLARTLGLFPRLRLVDGKTEIENEKPEEAPDVDPLL